MRFIVASINNVISAQRAKQRPPSTDIFVLSKVGKTSGRLLTDRLLWS
jgi:hypothetical protein